ncbi:MAG: FAD-dependent oxidoreductase [Rhodospirillales bacterium]|nr:FAD-dependent oxidoreductase [Rhodospirillales bacterium]
MAETCQLAIIGAGPAGMAAAIEAAGLGLSVVVLDEQAAPGGQIYRSLEKQPPAGRPDLGEDYDQGRPLLEAFRESAADYRPQSQVWEVTQQRDIHFQADGAVQHLRAEHIIIAGGAQERPVPIPGWTLPGVMTAGAAQILLKTASLGARHAVFAGSGPLLYLVVWQYVQAGLPVAAVLETTPLANYRRAAPSLPGGLSVPSYLIKGLRLIADLKRAGVSWISGVEDLRADGEKALEAVSYRKGSRWRQIETGHLFLHQGVVPDTNLTVSLGCRHTWNAVQACWHVERDIWGGTSLDGISVAGDGGGIGGAMAARLQGRLAALSAAQRLGVLSAEERDRRSRKSLRILTREGRTRKFLDILYHPRDRFRRPPDDQTVVCRCEEITAGEVRAAAALGCQGPNQLKAFTRAGMGPCQGRQCGLTVSEILAQAHGTGVADIGHLRTRPPLKPVTLGALAACKKSRG